MSQTCRIFQVLLNKVTVQGAVDGHAREGSASGLVTLSPIPSVPSFPSASGAWSWSRSPGPRGFFRGVFRVGSGGGGGPVERVPGTVASGGGRRAAASRLKSAGCPLPAMPMQGGALSPEEELRAAVLQLRETVVQQKETLGAQREAIRELTGKLARCEGLASGKARGAGATGKDTMGDLPRDPGHVVEQLSRSLQTLKDRLESLEHQLRANVSNAGLPGDFREVLQRRLGELERQLLRKVAELEDEKSLLHNETSAHRQKTESTLNALLQRVTELERGNSAFKSPDAFKVSLPLRTNYIYGKIKKTLPELYAFTICLWLRSSASPGIGTPFSYAVPGQANEIVLIEWGNNPIELLINDKVAQLPLFVSDGKWHHICVTWTTRDGMWEAFQDGEKLGTGENLAPWHPIKPGGVLILGQEQDTVGGRFDATQAFVGELSQFNIWDRVLRAQEIVNIANCSTNMPGNIIPWVDNNVDVFGGASKWPVETCEERLLDL
uniref:Neuronal pentraxin 2 n=1 Tax=Saimiri boliviensis boliviensis TaxID=39432 RepID=A0A2K6U0I6_SAIBB